MSECPHKQLKKQMVGEFVYYVCECGQKFRAEPWDGKVSVREPGAERDAAKCVNCGHDYLDHYSEDEHSSHCLQRDPHSASFVPQACPCPGFVRESSAPPDPRKDLAALEQAARKVELSVEEVRQLTLKSWPREHSNPPDVEEWRATIAALIRNNIDLKYALAEMRGAKR